MKQNKVVHLIKLIEDVKALDQIIDLHLKEDKSDFVVSQYQSRKNKLIADFIDALVSPSVVSEQSFFTIKLAIDKFYPHLSDSKSIKNEDEGFSALASALK